MRSRLDDRRATLRLQRAQPAHGDANSNGDQYADGHACTDRVAELKPDRDGDARANGRPQRDAQSDGQPHSHADGNADRHALANQYADDHAAARSGLRL